MASKILGKLGWQIALNFLLATGAFLTVIVLHARYGVEWAKDFPWGRDGLKAAMWLAAMLVGFPCLIAIWRKIQAGGMMVAELSVSHQKAGANTGMMRGVVSSAVLLAGTGLMLLWLLLMSSTLMPSWRTLLVALGIAAVVGFLLYRSAVKLYARAQFALHDTFATPPDRDERANEALPSLLREAKLESVQLAAETPVAGRMIAELKLRTATGASIVGIARDGTNIINPGPDEELSVGDEVLLIGSEKQLEAARKLLMKNA